MLLKELENDTVIQEKLENLSNSIKKMTSVLDTAINIDETNLSLKDRIDLDLFIAYCMNTLFFIYLRTIGEDPNESEVKNQLDRVKEYILKAKKEHERHTLRPRVDQAAARRFIKHGIHHNESDSDSNIPNKKIKTNNE